MKTGGNLAGEITHINKNKDESRDINSAANSGNLHGGSAGDDKDLSWEKPAWTQNAGLKSTAKGTKTLHLQLADHQYFAVGNEYS